MRGESVETFIGLVISVETNGQVLSYRLSLSFPPLSLSMFAALCFHVAHFVSIVRLLIVAFLFVLMSSRDTSSTPEWILMKFDLSMF